MAGVTNVIDGSKERCTIQNMTFPPYPNPNSGILNAKYLIENFVTSYVTSEMILGEGFRSYSGKVCAELNIVRRAMAQLSKSAKII